MVPVLGPFAQSVAVGVGAGLASALLFLAVFTGTIFSFPLFALSGLPIGIAALGWGPVSGGLAALVSGAALAVTEEPSLAGYFGLLVGGPALWVALVAGQPVGAVEVSGRRSLAFRPLSEILIHTAGFVTLAVIAAGVLRRYDPAIATRDFLDLLAAAPPFPDVTPAEMRSRVEPLARTAFAWLPFTAAPMAMTLLVINTWVAARVTALSGRLARPWTPLPSLRVPVPVIAALLAGMVGSLLSGGIGRAFNVIASASGFTFALGGLAALHAITAGRPNRALALGLAYVLTVILTFPILLWAVLGIVDSTTDLRHRFAAGGNRKI
ncbi:MAG: hypothetical protein U1E56_09585 [Bauldia sp.]